MDDARSCDQILTSILDLARFKPLEIGKCVSVSQGRRWELLRVRLRRGTCSQFQNTFNIVGPDLRVEVMRMFELSRYLLTRSPKSISADVSLASLERISAISTTPLPQTRAGAVHVNLDETAVVIPAPDGSMVARRRACGVRSSRSAQASAAHSQCRLTI